MHLGNAKCLLLQLHKRTEGSHGCSLFTCEYAIETAAKNRPQGVQTAPQACATACQVGS